MPPRNRRRNDPEDPPTQRLEPLAKALEVADESFKATAPDRRDWTPTDYTPR